MAKSRSAGEAFDRNVICFLGFPLDVITMDGALETLADAKSAGTRCFISTPNVNFLARAQWDDAFRDSVIASDLVLADGMPVVWLCRLLGVRLPGRVAGSDMFNAMAHRFGTGEGPISVFFFGGRDGAADAAFEKLKDGKSGVRAVGFLNPGFGTVEEMSTQAVIDEVNAANADFVVVSLGAAKGQEWIMHNRDRLDAPILCHLGAVVDFVAGTVQRSPEWLQRLGLEWAYRISQDFGLWRRYATDGLILLRTVVTSLLPLALAGGPADRRADGVCERGEEGGGRLLSLRGRFGPGSLPALREAFAWAVEGGGGVIVDLNAVSGFCLYSQGQVLILRKLVEERGGKLIIRGASPALQTAFRRSGLSRSVSPTY